MIMGGAGRHSRREHCFSTFNEGTEDVGEPLDQISRLKRLLERSNKEKKELGVNSRSFVGRKGRFGLEEQ
jgi:hypothetical protein